MASGKSTRMSTRERRDAMFEAVEHTEGFSRLRDVIVSMVEQGTDPGILINDMQDLLALLAEEHEDMMLDVMDQLVGYCSQTQRILPRPQPGDADFGLR